MYLKKLIPILTSNEVYTYPRAIDEDVEDYGTVLVSKKDRLTPDCKYLLWDGPQIGSHYNVTLLRGNEVIFTHYINYVYKIKWRIKGNVTTTPMLLHLNIDSDNTKTIAYRSYDTNGNLALLEGEAGIMEIYGMNFPLVVLCPDDVHIRLKIKAIKRLPNNEDPWAIGTFCAKTDDGRKIVYENKDGNRITRVVSDDLKAYNDAIRKEHFSHTYGPCSDNLLHSELKGFQDPSIITIDTKAAQDYNREWNADPALDYTIIKRSDSSYIWLTLNLENGGRDEYPIGLTSVLNSTLDQGASYISTEFYGYVEVDVNFSFDIVNIVKYYFDPPGVRNNVDIYGITSEAIFDILDYYTGNSLPIYRINDKGDVVPVVGCDENCYSSAKCCGNSIVNANVLLIDHNNTVDTMLSFRKKYIISVPARGSYWLKIGRINIDNSNNIRNFRGNITMKYLPIIPKL